MDCLVCRDTKWVKYDWNHSTICKACCKHDTGWFLLSEAYGHPGKWCCRTGCGLILTYSEVRKRLEKETKTSRRPIIMNIA